MVETSLVAGSTSNQDGLESSEMQGMMEVQ